MTQTDLDRQIVQAIKNVRESKKISAQQLADATAKLGRPLSRNMLASLEIGRKRVDIADVLVIAAALDVAPAELLFPGAPTDQVTVLPGKPMTVAEAHGWLVGNPDLATLRENLDTLQRAMTGLSLATARTAKRAEWGIPMKGKVK